MKYDLNIPGWMSVTDLEILNRLASYVPENGNILEVGCFLGRSTSALYYGKPSSAKLEVVDIFQIDKEYTKDITDSKYLNGHIDYKNKIKNIMANSNSWLDAFRYCLTPRIANQIKINVASSVDYELTKEFDLVFIDANHSLDSVLKDIRKFSSENTLLVGDDFNHKHLGVVQAIATVRFELPRTLIVPANSKIWIMVPSTGYWSKVFSRTFEVHQPDIQ